MLVSGFMIARVVMPCSNPRLEIVACIALMALSPVRLYRKVIAAVHKGNQSNLLENYGNETNWIYTLGMNPLITL